MTSNTTTTAERGLFFRLLLGPISLMGSLSLLILKTPENFFLASFVMVLGMGLTAFFRLKGLLSSLVLLSALVVYRMLFSDAGSLWFFGAVFTVALSYVITLLTLEDVQEKFSDVKDALFDSFKEKEEKIFEVQEALKSQEKVLELSRVELVSETSKLKSLEAQFSKLSEEKKALEKAFHDRELSLKAWQDKAERFEREKKLETSKLEELYPLIERLEREKDLFENTVSRIQAELEQVQMELEQSQTELKAEKAKPAPEFKPEPAPEEPPKSESEWRRLWGMHRQLREQFEMKSSQLDQARKDLFTYQEEAATLKIALTELESEPAPELKVLTQELESLYKKIDDQEQEIEKLEALVKMD